MLVASGLFLMVDCHGWDCALESGNEAALTFSLPLQPKPGSTDLWEGTIIIRGFTLQEGPRNRATFGPPRMLVVWQDRVVAHGVAYTSEGFIGDMFRFGY